jgi:hypothetical protein
MARSAVRLAVLAVTGVIAAACSASQQSPSVSATTAPAAGQQTSAAAASASAGPPAAAATESPPPGDIPDSTIFVPYQFAAGNLQVKVPEGWARTQTAGAVSFTDKLNTITLATIKAAAPTPSSAQATEVPRLQGSLRDFTLTGVSSVTRTFGPAILIKYKDASQPDPVTGKVYTDEVERYEFYRNGFEAIVTLSGPAGADNVDPWRKVTDSFRWLR